MTKYYKVNATITIGDLVAAKNEVEARLTVMQKVHDICLYATIKDYKIEEAKDYGSERNQNAD